MKRRNRERFAHVLIWDQGNFTTQNEDVVYIRSVLTKAGICNVYAICDGMGGCENGGAASKLCVARIDEWVEEKLIPILKVSRRKPYLRKQLIRSSGLHLFKEMNEELFRLGRRNQSEYGTTALVCVMFRKQYYMLHIGDCYAFRMRKTIRQLTKVHRTDGHVVTRCLGMNRDGVADFVCGTIRKRDSFLLCSDGFIADKPKQYFEELMCVTNKDRNHAQYETRLKGHTKRLKKLGRTDNISAICIWKENS